MSGPAEVVTQDHRDLAASDSNPVGAAVSSPYYEIRIAGVLPSEALLDFDRLTVSVEPVETVVLGPLRDQAALQGLLARLEASGIQLLEVRRLRAREADADPGSAGGRPRSGVRNRS
jgi:hypothetical protein